MTYLVAGPKTDDLPHMLKVRLSGFFWHAQGSGVTDMAIVFVQVFRDKVHVHLYETLTPLVHEFHSRRFGVFLAGHFGIVIDGGCFYSLTLLEFPRLHHFTNIRAAAAELQTVFRRIFVTGQYPRRVNHSTLIHHTAPYQ